MPTRASARPSAHSVSVVLGIKETMRRGGCADRSAVPDASTSLTSPTSLRPPTVNPGTRSVTESIPASAPLQNPSAAQALHEVDDVTGAIGQLGVELRDLLDRRVLVDGVLEVGHRHAEELEQPARLVAGHAPSSVEGQLGHVTPARLALRLEVLRVHEVEAAMEVHLELPAAIAVVEVGHGVVEERAHRVTAEPDEPLKPDRAGEGFLDAEGGRELGPHAREFLEELAARRSLDAVIHEITAEVGLEELPAPGGNHCGASVSWAQGAELRAGAPVLRDGDAPRGPERERLPRPSLPAGGPDAGVPDRGHCGRRRAWRSPEASRHRQGSGGPRRGVPAHGTHRPARGDAARRASALPHAPRDPRPGAAHGEALVGSARRGLGRTPGGALPHEGNPQRRRDSDRKSTRLNSSHGYISYSALCLKKKKTLCPVSPD